MAGFEVITYGRFWVIAEAIDGRPVAEYSFDNSPSICRSAPSTIARIWRAG